ncbi:MAG: sigma-70 family RNA polymerase sigma factor [archaeon]
MEDRHIKMDKYIFKKIKNILYHQAHKIKKRFNDRYEVDELVNEVWLKGDIHKVDIYNVKTRAYWDMIDYIRRIEGRKGTFREKTLLLTNRTSVDDKENYFDKIIDSRLNCIQTFLNKEQVKKFISILPEKKKNIIKKYYLRGMNLKDIGKIYNVKGSTISKIKKQSIEEIREEFDIITS